MQIVIDIPDDWERRIKCNIRPNTIECGEFVESIWKGTILPKTHGRLIDADAFQDRLTRQRWTFRDVKEYKEMMLRINEAPTIIEADKEESEETNEIHSNI